MKNLSRVLALFLVVLMLAGIACVGASALIVGDTFSVKLTAEQTHIKMMGKTQLKVTITVPQDSEATEDDFTVKYNVSNPKIASVNESGMLTGKLAGEAIVTVTVTDKEENSVSDSISVFVTAVNNPIYSLLSDRAILGYRYNYDGDYFYTDNDNCWQSRFGFLNAFDIVCPYILIEYDYIRMHFNYGGKAWMIQLWKGQYGMVFYGSEIGVYYRDEEIGPDEEITAFTHYKCATEKENRLNMSMTLYWDELNNGNYVHQFTRPYDSYWWCTGFLPGHLWQTEPSDELRMESYIDFPDEGMARVFGDQLTTCGFAEQESAEDMPLDAFHVNGNRVTLRWQNISEAESTVIVKASIAALFATGSLATILGFLLFSGVAALFFIIVL